LRKLNPREPGESGTAGQCDAGDGRFLPSGACIGAEALLRWSHPTFGDVSPAEFIPIVDGLRRHGLPAQVVKIDRSFVHGIERDERKRSLVAAMIKLSHDLGHRVVAEGVETADVLDVLKDADCDEAQGYLYARPLAPQAFVRWVEKRGKTEFATA
jgi:EAL domain-containing protein (putative c-di-GMP-specific phosphodiesterase class I)